MPGLLDRFKQIQQPRQKTGKSLLDLAIDHMATNAGKVFPTTEEMNANLRNVLSPEVANSMLGIGELNKEAAKAYEEKMKNIALAALTVYHGSPHKFDKFDMNKIGTGEGAQAYGHGLYFAESPEVAKSYVAMQSEKDILKNLSVDDIVKNYGLTKAHAEKIISNWRNAPFYADEGGNATESFWRAIKGLKQQEIENAANENFIKYGYKSPSEMQSALDRFINTKDMTNMVPESVRPAFYKVDIPDEAIPRMLEWDKPLSQQSPEIVKAWQATKANLPPNAIDDLGGDLSILYGKGVKPDEFLGTMSSIGGSPSFGEQLLKAQGIPGIRYLDGMSRNAGQDSYNYVLFDDQLPRILEINGVPTGNQPWLPGEFQGLLGR